MSEGEREKDIMYNIVLSSTQVSNYTDWPEFLGISPVKGTIGDTITVTGKQIHT